MNKFYNALQVGVLVVALLLGSCQKETIKKDATPNQVENLVSAAENNWQPIDGQYIVVFKNTSGVAKKAATLDNYPVAQENMRATVSNYLRANLSGDVNLERVYTKAVAGFVARMSEADAEALKTNRDIAYIEQDRIVALKRPSTGGGDTGSASQEIPWGITRVGGGATYTGSAVAWVIDTGIDIDHEDLNVDAQRGFSAFTKGRDAGVDDGNGHGTHCAGTIAAIDNSVGVVGVAAGATVIPVKVLDSRGSGSLSGVIAGMDYVAANAKNGDVANMSLGGGASQAIDDAAIRLAASGVKVAVAAGNESDDANNHSPARANHPNLFTISASDINDDWAYFSNYGNPPVDFCAPGYSILSTYKGGGYDTLSGTSMATPHVAGILLWGSIRTDGVVNGDPDGNPDSIAHL
jgi:subtilisin family serine protease